MLCQKHESQSLQVARDQAPRKLRPLTPSYKICQQIRNDKSRSDYYSYQKELLVSPEPARQSKPIPDLVSNSIRIDSSVNGPPSQTPRGLNIMIHKATCVREDFPTICLHSQTKVH